MSGAVHAGDSRLIVSYRDYAILENERFKDLDYSKDFSVEAWFYLPRGVIEGRYGTMLSKGRQAMREGGWFVGSTGHDYFESLGHDAASGVYSPASGKTAGALNAFPGVIGDVYVISVWNQRARTLTTYVNGVSKEVVNSAVNPQQFKNAAPFLLNGNGYFAPPYDKWGGRSGEYYLARLWNRALSPAEVDQLSRHVRETRRHALPTAFNRGALLSEWLMTETCDANGAPGTTHIRDFVGSNHLRLAGGARIERGVGALAAVYPVGGATGVGPSVLLTATGGRGMFSSPKLPIHYSFQVSESPNFDDATLKESGWIAHRSEWQPVLRPGAKYYWRVKARDSSVVPVETKFTPTISFATRNARNWYARPRAAKGTYGQENGTSYENAFNGFRPSTQTAPPASPGSPAGVKWGPGGIEAGDTLYIVGRHFVNRNEGSIPGNWARDAVLYVGVDGHSPKAPVTIRMDSNKGSGEIWNFGRRAASSIVWSGPDHNGVYQADFPGGVATPIAADVDKLKAILMEQAPAATWVGGNGKWFKEGNRLYVKMPDGGHPADRIWEVGQGASVVLERRSNVRLLNCNLMGVSFRDYLGGQAYAPALPARSHHVTIDGCRLTAGSGHLAQVALHDGNDYWTIRNSRLHDYLNGVYAFNKPDRGTADNVTVEGNDIRYMGNGRYGYSGGDAHAIGVQNGAGWVIQDNVTEDTGTAIELWAGLTTDPASYMENHVIRRNVIRAAHSDRATLGTGIAISGENGDSLGQRTGISVYYNVIEEVDGYGIGSNNPDPVLFANNTILRPGRAGIALLISTGNEPKGFIYNNLIVTEGKDFLFVTGANGEHAGLRIDNNCYYSRTGAGTFYSASLGRVSFLTWKDREGYDKHGVEANPLLVESDAGAYSLQPGSPCIDRGTQAPYQGDVRDVTQELILLNGVALFGPALDAGARESK